MQGGPYIVRLHVIMLLNDPLGIIFTISQNYIFSIALNNRNKITIGFLLILRLYEY
jgi:hypothetical protein